MLNPVTTHKSKVCFGYTNKAMNNSYLPFFDYDSVEIEDIMKELTFLRDKYQLSQIYIFESKNGFNALSLDKLPYRILVNLYNDCNFVCEDYLQLGLKRSFLTLRIGNDKKLFHIIKSSNTYYKKSLAHAILMNVFFNVFIETYNDKSFDNSMYIRLKVYRSEKHGFLKVDEL
ncbi:MAG: hypothetical protein MUO21_06975 [Nitrososphaeraceae archaeon]|nr:hypothetical protein [Nitrososphaeraceae archaeon]